VNVLYRELKWWYRWFCIRHRVVNDIKCRVPGSTVLLHHGLGVTMNPFVVLGENVTVYPLVTLGTRRSGGDAPVIGDGVVLMTGCCVLGDVVVGRGCVVGSGAVVLSDVPNGAVVVGVPAKVVNGV